jgi:hypothetical protein
MMEAEYIRRLPDGRFLAVIVRPFNSLLVVGRWLALGFDDDW